MATRITAGVGDMRPGAARPDRRAPPRVGDERSFGLVEAATLILAPIGAALVFSALCPAHEGGSRLSLSAALGLEGLDVTRFICSSTAPAGSIASFTADASGRLAMWAAMLGAMMFPGLSPCGDVASVRPRWSEALLLHAGYVLPWLAGSIVCAFVQAAAYEVAPRAATGGLGFAGLLILAGLYQWTPWKRAGLAEIRAPHGAPAPSGRLPWLRVGLSMGRSCLISNIGLMSAMAAAEMSAPIVAAGFAAMVAERLAPSRRASSLLGALLIAAGVVAAAPHGPAIAVR